MGAKRTAASAGPGLAQGPSPVWAVLDRARTPWSHSSAFLTALRVLSRTPRGASSRLRAQLLTGPHWGAPWTPAEHRHCQSSEAEAVTHPPHAQGRRPRGAANSHSPFPGGRSSCREWDDALTRLEAQDPWNVPVRTDTARPFPPSRAEEPEWVPSGLQVTALIGLMNRSWKSCRGSARGDGRHQNCRPKPHPL